VAPSLEQALFDIYRTAQERVFWGHVTAIVISDEALKQGIDTIYDSISRYYEFRLTPWVYATRGPIREILSMGGFYEQSTLSTILQEPKEIHSQTSFVEPIKLHKLMSRINEPGYTVCIPSVAVNTEQWKAELKPEPKLAIDGAIFMKQDKVKSFMSLKELSGLRWIRPGTVRAGIPVPDKTNPEVEVVFDHPKAKYELVRENERLRYRLSMRAKGYIVNWDGVEFASFNELIEQRKRPSSAKLGKSSAMATTERQTCLISNTNCFATIFACGNPSVGMRKIFYRLMSWKQSTCISRSFIRVWREAKSL